MVKKVQYFWKKRPAVSIIMIQVHYLEIKIADLMGMLETFTIPSEPFESLQMLKKFVSRWLRLQQYVENLACRLQNLEEEGIGKQEFLPTSCSKYRKALI